MADFMRRCKGRVMVSIHDHPGIRYTIANQRHGKVDFTGELVIMNWLP